MSQTPAPTGTPMGPPPVAIIVSKYNASVTDRLLEGAKQAYLDAGGSDWTLGVIEAPGTFELAHLAGVLVRQTLWRGVVCLGCVIKGETKHDEHLARAVSQSIANLAVRTGTPIGFGIITADTPEQAAARAGGPKGNKGAEAMNAVIESLHAIESVRRATTTKQVAIHHQLRGKSSDKAGGA